MSGVDPGVPNVEACKSRLCLLCGLAPPVAGGPYTAESSPWCARCREEIQAGRETPAIDRAEQLLAALDRKIREEDRKLRESAEVRLGQVVNALLIAQGLADWCGRQRCESRLFQNFVATFKRLGAVPTVGALIRLGQRAGWRET